MSEARNPCSFKTSTAEDDGATYENVCAGKSRNAFSCVLHHRRLALRPAKEDGGGAPFPHRRDALKQMLKCQLLRLIGLQEPLA